MMRGFLSVANRIHPSSHGSHFRGSSSSQSKQEVLLSHSQPELHEITLQMSDKVNVYVITLISNSLNINVSYLSHFYVHNKRWRRRLHP
jgi:hypothetical protein